MDQARSQGISIAAWVLGAATIGAAAMYMMDPEMGARRRALVRDKLRSAGIQVRESFDAKSRDLRNRVHGVRAETRRFLSGGNSGETLH